MTNAFALLAAKDLRVEWRSRDTLAATATVALLIALTANVAFAGRVAAALAVPGALWAAIAFAAQVGLARSFVVERDRGTLAGLLASPASSLAIFGAKLVVNLGVLLLVTAVALAALALFFGLGLVLSPMLLLLLATGALGVALATTMSAAMAMHGRNWVLLVPLLTLPALFPVLAAAVPATGALLAGAPDAAVLPHLRVLVAYDVIFGAVAWLLAPFLIEP